jgi:DUF1680 family protein
VKAKAGEYIEIMRIWKRGDTVEAQFGMALRTESARDNASCVALMYGPIVLAGYLAPVAHPFSNPMKYNDYYTFDFDVPQNLVDKATFSTLKDIRHLSSTRFVTRNGITVAPFYDMQRCRYAVYWKLTGH